MKILRVNTSDLQVSFEDLPKEWMIIGGRGLSAEILNKEMSPEVDPLSPEAKLIIAGGPLAGTLAPSCGRLSVGGKSPLTLGIKEANSGGPVAQKLDRLGIRAIVIEGAPKDGSLYILKVTNEGASLEDAARFKGMRNYDLVKSLHDTVNEKVSILSIGVAGEKGWK
ncbi:MAG: aldehyde ferredoxin oxidoreductase, partial [Deltaproteobacteria bacterium]|nr:aldehyde ferredoxin oxidoreductase [Deltaproteobacteria bacterium]